MKNDLHGETPDGQVFHHHVESVNRITESVIQIPAHK